MKRAALAAAAAVLVVELGLRLVGYAAPQWYELDRELGWRLHPHRHGWYLADGVKSPVHVTADAVRDREHTLDKPDGVFRIAVLGDEYSEAMAVPVQQTWWWQLPRELQRCGFQPERLIEVLNFGVAGYGTAQEYVLLETKAMRYQPDLVLLQFSPNDVMDNSRELAAEKNRPFFVLDRHGVARIDDSFNTAASFDDRMQTRYRLAEEIADHSRSYQLARQMAELAFIGEAHAGGGDLAVLREPRDAVWQDAWRVTEAVIAKMNSFTRRNGAQLAVVSIPHPRHAGQGLAYPDQRLAAFGKQSGIEVLPLEAMQPPMYSAAGHWTREAHRAAAEALAHRLCGATAQPG